MSEYKTQIREHVKYQFDNLPDKIILEVVEPKSSTRSLMEKIQKRGDSYVVTDSSGNKVLGKHKTKSAALKQIAAVEASKAARMDEGLKDIGKGLAQGGALGAMTLGLALGGQNKEPSVTPEPTPNTGEVGQLEDKPSERPTLVTPNTLKKKETKKDPYGGRFDEIVKMTGKFEGGKFQGNHSITHPDPIHGNTIPTNAGQTKRGLTPEGRKYLESKGHDIDKVFSIGGRLPKEDANHLRKLHMQKASSHLENTYKDFHDHPHQVKAILHDMHYNLGAKGLSGFKKMNAAIDARDYKTAAKEAKDSKWYRQTGHRAKTHVQTLKSL